VRLCSVNSVSSSVCSIDSVKPFVLFPHEGRDDQREQDYKRDHDDQMKQGIHAFNLSHRSGFAWTAFGSIPPAFGQPCAAAAIFRHDLTAVAYFCYQQERRSHDR